MKRIMNTLLAVLVVSFVSAQVKPVQTVKISTPTVQCEMCKSRIETYLKRIDGLTFVNVNPKKKETTVKFISDRTNIEEIKTAIANSGFDADEIKATEDAYKRLPVCCKKPEDGGGMKKN
jgi:mercuric ion binding protein